MIQIEISITTSTESFIVRIEEPEIRQADGCTATSRRKALRRAADDAWNWVNAREPIEQT